MIVAVCAKQIPSGPMAFDASTHWLDRSGDLVLDDSDSYGVETGLRLAEQGGGGDVVLISMVPGGATGGLRTALAMGAARAVVVSDPALAGSDGLGTARVLAAVVERVQADLVVCATESTDGGTGTVPVQMAELLGWPAVTFAKHVELVAGALLAHRQTEPGYDVVSCPLPAVVTVTAGVVEVRYPSLRGIIAAKSKRVEVLDLAQLALAPGQVGAAGARQEVITVDPVPARVAGRTIEDEGSAHEEVLALLEAWGVL